VASARRNGRARSPQCCNRESHLQGESVFTDRLGGVVALTKTLARELVGKGIGLNTVCPGPTDTAILRSFTEGPDGAKILEGLKRAIPMRRLGSPED